MRGISWLAAKPVSFSRKTLLLGVSNVCIANRLRNGLSGIRIPVGERDFSFLHTVQAGSGHTQPWVLWLPVFFFTGIRPGHGVNHSLPSTAEVKEWVALYPYAPSLPSWRDQGKLHPYLYIEARLQRANICLQNWIIKALRMIGWSIFF